MPSGVLNQSVKTHKKIQVGDTGFVAELPQIELTVLGFKGASLKLARVDGIDIEYFPGLKMSYVTVNPLEFKLTTA